MRLFMLVAAVCLLTSACTTTSTRVATAISKPSPGARVLLVKPDVDLGVLTLTGGTEPRADWTTSASQHLTEKIQGELAGKSHTFAAFDPVAAMGGRGGQVLRLNQAVGASIAMYDYGPFKLPTKKGGFDWTLGQGAVAFGQANAADYALFVVVRGTWSSDGRKAAAVGMALLGASMPMGSQQASASLVDLKTGRVVWYNFLMAGAGDDMRQPDGAGAIVTALLKDAPL